jgi:hypothetical protein
MRASIASRKCSDTIQSPSSCSCVVYCGLVGSIQPGNMQTHHHAVSSQNHPGRGCSVHALKIILDPAANTSDCHIVGSWSDLYCSLPWVQLCSVDICGHGQVSSATKDDTPESRARCRSQTSTWSFCSEGIIHHAGSKPEDAITR